MYPLLCTDLLPFVLGQMGLKLEVGLELAGAELALVGAVYHNYLFGVSLAVLVLVGLHLDLRMPVLHSFPSAAIWIGLSLCHTLLQLYWSFCNPAFHLKNKEGAINLILDQYYQTKTRQKCPISEKFIRT